MQNEAHINSWYAASANQQLSYPPLQGEVRADVCIIGGGYTGLASAIHLRKAGYSVVLLEANRVGWGASGRNGGHVGTGQRAEQDQLEKWVGLDQAKALWQLGLEAVDTVCGLIDEYDIDCELKTGNLHVAAKPGDVKGLQEEVEHLSGVYGYDKIRYIDSPELAELTSGQGFHGGTVDTGCKHLHPLNYALGLAAAADALGATLHEGSRVTELHARAIRSRLRRIRATVTASFLVLACNGYLEKLEPRTAGRIMPINNYMLATEPLPEALARQPDPRRYLHVRQSVRDQLLEAVGGQQAVVWWRRNLQSTVSQRHRRVRAQIHAASIYPELADSRIDYGWGGTLAITMNRMPDFGRLSSQVFYAHGYSGHGVPIATLAGKLLAEAISGTAERFDVMASVPSRQFPGRYLAALAGAGSGHAVLCGSRPFGLMAT